MLTEKEKEIARHIQGEIPLVRRPFQQIGAAVGLAEEEVMDVIRSLKQRGVIRKIAAIVRHQRVGYEKNAMVVWAVPSERCETVGQLFATFKEITHCYERTPPFEGKFNIFTMVHFRTGDPGQLIKELAIRAGIADFRILTSIEEFKKSSMAYF